MNAVLFPRWFLLSILVVAFLAAFGVAYGLRYRPIGGLWVLDSWNRTACTPDACVKIGDSVISLRELLHRGQDYPIGTAPPLPP